ncbi:MAG: fibro-slime domain-containing protein, partial [Lachnospiraceae bacterium]|nr:fibro-slime domain-containing protein [Lachnospiraceae bacterium]
EEIGETEETETAAVTLTLLESADGEVTEADVATVSSYEEELPILTVSLLSANSVVALAASGDGNHDFTVQYYAYLDIVSTTGDATLDVIDTSGGVLPQNGTTPATTTIGLTVSGSNGLGTLYKVATAETLTQVYSDSEYTFSEAPGLEYFDKLQDNTGYTLSEIWVLTGTDADSTNTDDWTIYTYSDGISFTNTASEASDSVIYIADDAVIRLVYDTSSGTYTNSANLYDYDISDGNAYSSASTSSSMTTNNGSNTVYAYTYMSGINSASNYSGTGTKLAFGNNNTGTGLGDESWSGNTLNKANSKGYDNCTFGLVTSLTDGTINYANGVDAPNLFDDGSATGKTTYNNQTLTFSRDGDTYTLTAVSGEANVSNLDTFLNFSKWSSIFTNNFWPMDTVSSYDTSGHDIAFGSYSLRSLRKYFGYSNGTLPYSDDYYDHNSYFGMQYSVEFTLSEDYVGPLNYYFFGDDDMWVFLDGMLVCDIGGVHSSVGEYVDLWDYIEKGSSGTHTLTFYYTERGASGSTCYMRFTLPSVTSATKVQTTGSLCVEKEVNGSSADTTEEFTFTLTLANSVGTALTDSYSYAVYNSDGQHSSTGTITSGSTFTLSDGQYIIVNYLPDGTKCTVTESDSDYATTYTVDSGTSTEGRIASTSVSSGNTTTIHFLNTLQYDLPFTGGSGILPYTTAGIALFGGATLVLFKRRKKYLG